VIVGIRHARVENPENVVYARLQGFHLSERGRDEAAGLGRELSSAPVTAVYSSPLERAAETAAALARPHGVEVVMDDRLLEWSFWVRWQGLPWSRIRERDPDLLEAYANDPSAAATGQPLEEAGRDVLAWAGDAERRHPDGLVIGVSHEAPLAAALLIGRAGTLGGYHGLNLPHLGTVRLRPGPPEIVDLVAWVRSC